MNKALAARENISLYQIVATIVFLASLVGFYGLYRDALKTKSD